MKELVIISGKGGTGKTSLTASFAALAGGAVLVDCDVGAADLHLILKPNVRDRHVFMSGHEAIIRQTDCIGCGTCLVNCRFEAVRPLPQADGGAFLIDPIFCEGCGVCADTCPVKAIDFPEQVAGEWYESDTRHGPLVHARLNIGAEHSGKLVHVVRQEARRVAEAERRELVIVDGPPGVGCPAIASITGASLVLVVTEPTMSGEHDLERALQLARHFQIPTAVCVNKWDLNAEMTDRIEGLAQQAGASVAGRIRYDRAFTQAQLAEQAVVEYKADGCAEDIRYVWTNVKSMLDRLVKKLQEERTI